MFEMEVVLIETQVILGVWCYLGVVRQNAHFHGPQCTFAFVLWGKVLSVSHMVNCPRGYLQPNIMWIAKTKDNGLGRGRREYSPP